MHHSPHGNAAQAYKRNEILNASPGKLILLLYDGAIQSLERARIELLSPGQEKSAKVGESLGKAMSIIGELRASLDHDVSEEIAGNLDRLYDFCLEEIYTTNVQRSAQEIKGAIRVMKTLKEGWDAVIPA